MRRPMTPWLLLVLASCDAHISAGRDVSDAAIDPDAPASPAPGSDAMQLGAWSTPVPVAVAASATSSEDDVTLSSSTLEMIFAVAGTGGKDLYYTSRTSPNAAWATPSKLPFDSAASDETPRFSGDDRTLYFASDRVTSGDLDIYSVTRAAAGSTTWGSPQPLAATINTAASEKWFAPCAGSRYVVVQSRANAGTDLLEGTLGAGTPAPIAQLNDATADDTSAFLTPDCLTIYFASNRVTPEKIFVSHRTAVTASWQPPAPVDDFKIPGGNGNQEDPWLSPDGRTFAFASNAAGNKDVYLSTR